MIYYECIENTIFGTISMAHTNKGVCGLYLHWISMQEMQIIFPNMQIVMSPSNYFANKVTQQVINNDKLESIPIDILSGTPFQRLVWNHLRSISSGYTETYGEVSQNIGMANAIRAVSTAIGKNPISIIIPCHRVIPTSGGIGKYRWGANIKKYLLDREQKEKTYVN